MAMLSELDPAYITIIIWKIYLIQRLKALHLCNNTCDSSEKKIANATNLQKRIQLDKMSSENLYCSGQ